MQKRNLVFIGRAYHQKTKSDSHILSLLETKYNVTVLRRDNMQDKDIVSLINQIRPDAVLFWCLPPSFTFHLLKLKCKNIIWAPMWDGFKKMSWKKRQIFRFYKIKVLCFSDVLYRYFKGTGLKCMGVKAFLKPQKMPKRSKSPPYTFFLWQREKDIGIDQLVQLVSEKMIKKVIYKSEIGKQTRQNYAFEIQKLPDWLPKEEYQSLLQSSDFFVAPRKAEGIGFSFLEPMSMGIPVIAYNNATMNEYVTEGENGFLFDDHYSLSQPLKSPDSLSEAVERCCDQFYQSWVRQQAQVLNFIEN